MEAPLNHPWPNDRCREECWGICKYSNCVYINEYLFDWSTDAYHVVEVCERLLQAWTCEHVVALKGYVASKERGVSHRSRTLWP